MNKAMRELEKAHKYFVEVKCRSSITYFNLLYLFAAFFANMGVDRGFFSFFIWALALLMISNLFKNAMDAAELGY